jgi:hypothetical protein
MLGPARDRASTSYVFAAETPDSTRKMRHGSHVALSRFIDAVQVSVRSGTFPPQQVGGPFSGSSDAVFHF